MRPTALLEKFSSSNYFTRSNNQRGAYFAYPKFLRNSEPQLHAVAMSKIDHCATFFSEIARETENVGRADVRAAKLIPEIELRASVRSHHADSLVLSLGAVCDEMIACVCECISCSGCNCEWSVARKTTDRSVHPHRRFSSGLASDVPA